MNPKQRMVLYTDGSARPNPGYGGWGIHGYLYNFNDPKSTYGYDNFIVTNRGYKEVKEISGNIKRVTPLKVYDIAGGCEGTVSNNYAELTACIAAVKLALTENIRHVLIKTDSEYIKQGFTSYINTWKKNGWINSSGNEVANSKLWKQADVLLMQLKLKSIKLAVEWVKGHVGQPGNEKVDKLANIGRTRAMSNNYEDQTVVVEANEYFGIVAKPVIINKDKVQTIKPSERHPLIHKPWMYFRSLAEGLIEGEYYFGNIGRDEDFLGKRDANGGYAIIKLDEPDPVLEKVRKLQINLSGDNHAIFIGNMKNILIDKVAKGIVDYGTSTVVQVSTRRKDMYFIDSVSEDHESHDYSQINILPLTREAYPPKLTSRVIDCLTFMKEKLLEYVAGNKATNTYYDITGEFYTVTTKSSKKGETVVYKLNDSLKVGTVMVPITITYEGNEITIRYNLTIDGPDRNVFKHLEKYAPKITLLVYKESPLAIRYMTVLECNGALSIWAGYYSNQIFLPIIKQK